MSLPMPGDDLRFAHAMADAADAVALPAFRRRAFAVADKDDGSPVTDIDRAVETLLRRMVASQRPSDGFVGEEFDAVAGERTWIVDPIDGTTKFVADDPRWATLIALHVGREWDVGLVSSPALGRRWWTDRHGAFTASGGPDHHPLQVSTTGLDDGARVACWPPFERLTGERRAAMERLLTRSSLLTEGDDVPLGSLRVAEGSLEAFVVFGGGPWDLAAPAAVVAGAGGRFSDRSGSDRIDSHSGVFTNGVAHDLVVSLLAGRAVD